MELREVPVSRIRVDYLRDVGTRADIDALVSSILEIGLVEPVVVESDVDHEGYFVLVAGYRRLRAYVAARVYQEAVAVPLKKRSDETLHQAKQRVAATLTIPAVVQEGRTRGWADKARRAENLARKDYTDGERRRLAAGRMQEPYHSSVVRWRELRFRVPEPPGGLYGFVNASSEDSLRRGRQAFANRLNRFMSGSDTNPEIWSNGMDVFTEIQDEIRSFQRNEDGGRGTRPSP